MGLWGLTTRVPAPAVHCLCPNAYTLGISTRMSHKHLKLMCNLGSLPTCLGLLFQTCFTHPVSEWLHYLPSFECQRSGHLPPHHPYLTNCQVLSSVTFQAALEFPAPPMPAACCASQLPCHWTTVDKCLSPSEDWPLHHLDIDGGIEMPMWVSLEAAPALPRSSRVQIHT